MQRADVHDALFALGLTIFAQLDLWLNIEAATHYGSQGAAAAATAVATLAVALRRRAPLLTAAVVAAAVALPELGTVLTIQLWGDFVPLLIAAYSVSRHAGSRRAALGAGLLAAALVAVELRVPVSGTAANIPFIWVPAGVAVASGRALRARESRLAGERDASVRAAVAEERERIARELHDIVAHCVSVMVVQAGAAEDLLDRDPPRGRRSCRSPGQRSWTSSWRRWARRACRCSSRSAAYRARCRRGSSSRATASSRRR
jgi:signal transduction histidine kinase